MFSLTERDRSSVICSLMIVVILWIVFRDYMYYKTEDPWMVTAVGDLDKLASKQKYNGSGLYDSYCSLSQPDRTFLDDYIAHTMLAHKDVRPSFKKRYSGFIKQILVASFVSIVVFSSQPMKQLKQNTVNYFVSSVI